jgi:quercetin dioxygenase-like cupin family protein
MINAFRLYTGEDGSSHIEKGVLNLGVLVDVESLMFQETAPQSVNDWHTAPVTQYVITLSGKLRFLTTTGEDFVVRAGDILIAEDIKGSGHRWIMLDDEPWKRAYVRFKPGSDIQFKALKV